jgi:hypothetical protein
MSEKYLSTKCLSVEQFSTQRPGAYIIILFKDVINSVMYKASVFVIA